MIQRYSVRLLIYSWFMKYLPPPLASAGRHRCFPAVTLVGANTNSPHNAVPNQQTASTSTQLNSSSDFDKVLAEYMNNLSKLIKENLGVDVRGTTRTYQKPYSSSIDSVQYPAGFRLPKFVKFSGEDSKSTFEHISQYLAQLGEAGSINELKVCLFSLSLTGTAFSWFSSLAPNSIGS